MDRIERRRGLNMAQSPRPSGAHTAARPFWLAALRGALVAVLLVAICSLLYPYLLIAVGTLAESIRTYFMDRTVLDLLYTIIGVGMGSLVLFMMVVLPAIVGGAVTSMLLQMLARRGMLRRGVALLVGACVGFITVCLAFYASADALAVHGDALSVLLALSLASLGGAWHGRMMARWLSPTAVLGKQSRTDGQAVTTGRAPER
jgi:hypothetical protein